MAERISLNELKKFFFYKDSELYWNCDRSRNIKAGTIVTGTITKWGYLRIHFDNKLCQAHRILYQLYHDIEYLEPKQYIDHINGSKLDNSKENLRLVNKSQNGTNTKLKKNNSSGEKNIIKFDNRGTIKYRVRIDLLGSRLIDKCFDSLVDAIKFRDLELKKHHGEYCRI